jgi:peptide/nickel transport system ATP-binding protein
LCAHAEPPLYDVGGGHLAACHMANPASGHPRLAAA